MVSRIAGCPSYATGIEAGLKACIAPRSLRTSDAWLGRYEIVLVDAVIQTVDLKRENGWLVFDDSRLVEEYLPGLFFDVRGEALDLRSDPATRANVPLRKVSVD
jgi:hypothetical protein